MSSETENQPEHPEVAPFADDQPISAKEDDRFNRWPFAERAAKTLANPAQSEAGLVVAIYGAWGEGKTSVLHMIEGALSNNERAICVRFNPWQFGDEEALLMAFFQTLAKTLGRSLSAKGEKIGKIIEQYAHGVCAVPLYFGVPIPSSFARVIQGFGRRFSKVTAEQKKSKIETILAKQEKRVIVFIDDIDRLDKQEIHEIFKLVKITADFKNVTYVLSFDRDVVAASIGGRYGAGNVAAGRDFLEKIIQVPLQLPRADPLSLCDMIFDEVKRTLGNSGIKLTESEESEFENNFSYAFADWIETPRRARQYCNALDFALPILKGEVNVADQMMIEAIRHFLPNLYKLIRKEKDLFLWGMPIEMDSYMEMPRNVSQDDFAQRQERAKIKSIESYDKKIADALGEVNALDIARVKHRIIMQLFPRFMNEEYNREYNGSWTAEKRVCSPDYFHRYFGYGMAEMDIADTDVGHFIKSVSGMSEAAVREYFLSQIKANLLFMFLRKLEYYENKVPVGSLGKMIAAVSELSSHIQDDYKVHNGYSTAVTTVAGYIKGLIERQSPDANRLDLSKSVVEKTDSIIFAGAFIKSIADSIERANSIERSGPLSVFKIEEEKVLGRLLAARIRTKAQDISFIEIFEGAAPLLLTQWKTYEESGEVAAWLESTLNKSKESLKNLFSAISGISLEDRWKRKPSSVFGESSYKRLSVFIEPELVAQAILNHYQNDIGNSEFETDSETSIEQALVRGFMRAHKVASIMKLQAERSI